MEKNNTCTNSCNNCIYLSRKEALVNECENAYCNKEKTIRLIEFRIPIGKDVKVPHWCPIKELDNIKIKLNKGKKLTNGEKKIMLMNHTPFIAWDDIKVNHIYHIPPLLGEQRKDVLVTWRGEYSCTFKNLSSGGNRIETIYPSTLESRFFVEHKLKKIEVEKK